MARLQNPNLITICIIISTITVGSSSSSSSIYDALRSNGLPIGLLPKGVTNFTIDPINGHFEAHLDQACDAKFETQVRYDLNISGTLHYGQIAELSGMAAQELFLWFPVKGIRVDIPSSGIIYFDVGVIFKQFSLSLFETPRDCAVVAPLLPPPELFLVDGRGRIVELERRREAKKHKCGCGDASAGSSAIFSKSPVRVRQAKKHQCGCRDASAGSSAIFSKSPVRVRVSLESL